MPTSGLRFGRESCERRAVILLATTAEAPAIPEQYATIASAVLLVGIFAGCMVYYRALIGLVDEGGRVRMDLFSFADMPVLGVLVTFFGLTAASFWLGKEPPTTTAIKVEQVLPGALSMAIFPLGVVIFFIARDVDLVALFGLRKVPFIKAVGHALGFLAALLPLLLLVSILTSRVLGKDAQLQPLMDLYQEGVRQRDWRVIWTTILAAGVIAPIGEEILFRGYIYPAMKRLIGALPAAFLAALLFAAIHNSAAGMATLTLLAIALTVAYERTGSLIVPMVMHALFNSTSLLYAAYVAMQKQ